MHPLKCATFFLALLLVLWAVYRLGQILLRIFMGLLFMGLVGLVVWYLFIR